MINVGVVDDIMHLCNNVELLCGLSDVKAEQELSEMSYQMEEMSARLEEADGLTSAQVRIIIVIIVLGTRSSAIA